MIIKKSIDFSFECDIIIVRASHRLEVGMTDPHRGGYILCAEDFILGFFVGRVHSMIRLSVLRYLFDTRCYMRLKRGLISVARIF